MRVVELFAGIGGMGLALPPEPGLELVAAFDQDAAARATHELNHRVPVHAQDLATVSAGTLARAGSEGACWLLSPPCQPFSRRGQVRDVDDPRCRGLLRLIELMPILKPEAMLLENVVGFHGSRAHALLREALTALDHDVADDESCPSEFGWPVRRPRQFVVSSARGLAPPPTTPAAAAPRDLAGLLTEDADPELAVPAEWLERIGPILPPQVPLPTITRSYGHSASGGGPILLGSAGPRFLSPDEILRLHAFPDTFRFPPELTTRQRLRLAGNSVHVASVARVAQRIDAG